MKHTILSELARRMGPFVALLDARYLPLLFAVAPQSYTVYAWLLAGGAPQEIAFMGGVGFEVIYVGAIAWADHGAGWQAARLPAITALVFSVAVAVAHYAPAQGALAVLHAGFPLVAYAYTVMMHAPATHAPTGAPSHKRADGAEAAFGSAPVSSHPAPQITNTVQVAVASPAEVRALPKAAPALPAHDAPTMRALTAYACKKCGEPVASGQAVAASARWGCAACKER
jgi:hypothetical protein